MPLAALLRPAACNHRRGSRRAHVHRISLGLCKVRAVVGEFQGHRVLVIALLCDVVVLLDMRRDPKIILNHSLQRRAYPQTRVQQEDSAPLVQQQKPPALDAPDVLGILAGGGVGLIEHRDEDADEHDRRRDREHDVEQHHPLPPLRRVGVAPRRFLAERHAPQLLPPEPEPLTLPLARLFDHVYADARTDSQDRPHDDKARHILLESACDDEDEIPHPPPRQPHILKEVQVSESRRPGQQIGSLWVW
mmetsp:Transcript_2197/g.5115  ORF Transcript_2197/g.5115 Transcript_2197/m.5115 type:complete len:248 (-) Transcript_2197:862-1605(-)